jgi:hypothetical protein
MSVNQSFSTTRSVLSEYLNHRLNIELDLQSLFGLLCTLQLYSLAETTRLTPSPPHLDLFPMALLVSQDRRHLFVTSWSEPRDIASKEIGRYLFRSIQQIVTIVVRINQDKKNYYLFFSISNVPSAVVTTIPSILPNPSILQSSQSVPTRELLTWRAYHCLPIVTLAMTAGSVHLLYNKKLECYQQAARSSSCQRTIRTTEYTQSGNCRFLAYIPS